MSSEASESSVAVSGEELRRKFEALQQNYRAERYPSLLRRRAHLGSLLEVVRTSASEIAAAASQDFGHRSVYDSKLGEVWISVNQIRHIQSSLKAWMKSQCRRTSWWFLPAKTSVLPQPLGVVGIISPWNYPLMLAVQPLAAALAAGNRVMLKLSEHTPRTSALLKQRLDAALGPDVLCVVLGGPETGRQFAELPFDHLLFTGSEGVGRQVALAAARNLVPVTLELGGKSPAILQREYPLDKFAAAIIQGKCYTAGQSCVAPDYLLVPKGTEDAVVEALRRRVAHCFPTLLNNPDYSGVLGADRRARLRAICAEAEGAGATRIELNPAQEDLAASSKLPLSLLLNVRAESRALKEELFGPVLPIVPYDDLGQAIDYVNARPRPLALYYFDHDPKRVSQVLRQTVSGGVTINDTLLHFINDDLPRGGVGSSGQGSYHGEAGFRAFSHQKAVFKQAPISGTSLFAPPYSERVDHILRLIAGKLS